VAIGIPLLAPEVKVVAVFRGYWKSTCIVKMLTQRISMVILIVGVRLLPEGEKFV
jgi:hypothetical protein